MTETKPNAELAYDVLDQIDANPERWRQSWWFTELDCGTAACFAGWASILSGDKPRIDEANMEGEFGTVVTPEGAVEHVEERAAQLLGLGNTASNNLFFSNNSRKDLGRLVEHYFGPRPEAAS